MREAVLSRFVVVEQVADSVLIRVLEEPELLTRLLTVVLSPVAEAALPADELLPDCEEEVVRCVVADEVCVADVVWDEDGVRDADVAWDEDGVRDADVAWDEVAACEVGLALTVALF